MMVGQGDSGEEGRSGEREREEWKEGKSQVAQMSEEGTIYLLTPIVHIRASGAEGFPPHTHYHCIVSPEVILVMANSALYFVFLSSV